MTRKQYQTLQRQRRNFWEAVGSFLVLGSTFAMGYAIIAIGQLMK